MAHAMRAQPLSDPQIVTPHHRPRGHVMPGRVMHPAPATRARRIQRTADELREGKKRPCCWAGCIHRTDKAPSKWQKAVLIDKLGKG